MALAMLDDSGTPDTFWGEAAHIAVNILNKAHVHVNSDKTPYELWYGNLPTINHFMVLEAIFLSRTMMKNLVSLNLEQMKEYFLAILLEVKHINVTIKYFRIFLNALIL